jgi:hypothetical protein
MPKRIFAKIADSATWLGSRLGQGSVEVECQNTDGAEPFNSELRRYLPPATM